MVYAILRLCKCVMQSRDRTHVLRNPEIACTISGFRECVIAQIPRLHGTYILCQPNTTPPGSKHEERIQLWSTRSRSLLRYADISADRKKKLNPNPLTATEQTITTFPPPSCFAPCKHADSQWNFFSSSDSGPRLWDIRNRYYHY